MENGARRTFYRVVKLYEICAQNVMYIEFIPIYFFKFHCTLILHPLVNTWTKLGSVFLSFHKYFRPTGGISNPTSESVPLHAGMSTDYRATEDIYWLIMAANQ